MFETVYHVGALTRLWFYAGHIFALQPQYQYHKELAYSTGKLYAKYTNLVAKQQYLYALTHSWFPAEIFYLAMNTDIPKGVGIRNLIYHEQNHH